MDRKTCRELAAKVEALVREALGDEYQVDEKGGSYDKTSYTVKIQIAEKTEEGEALTPERRAFVEGDWMHKLGADALDKTFSQNGRRYRIVGFKPRARKRPVICEDLSGRQYVFPIALVRNCLEWDKRAEEAYA